MQAPSDPARPNFGQRRLATIGIGAAVLTLSAAAALPAAADSHNSQSRGQSSTASGGHGASEATGHNPPGNNGTVFIHDVAGDHSPHNVPHVGCTFYADFFGFDAGQVVTVSFAGQAPTGKGTALGGTWTGVISTDDASGAGNDFDDELAFTADQLGVSALGAPAKQGYHVKMTVGTNEPGGKKSKVFWIAPCTPTGGAGGTTAGGTTGGAVLGSGTTTTTPGVSVSATGATKSSRPSSTARVLGERFTRPTGSATVLGLPFTGAEISRMIAAALVAILAGLSMLVATGRRYRPTHAG